MQAKRASIHANCHKPRQGGQPLNPVNESFSKTMEQVAKQLGVCITLTARDAVMKTSVFRRRPYLGVKSSPQCPAKSLDCSASYDADDDDTASTVSIDDTSFDSSFSNCDCPQVSFATQLVTAVYERPATTDLDRRDLYYTDFEYREFRRDYFYSRRESKVKIHEDVVTAVYHVPDVQEPENLYYSESDLQGFLDEFVASLNQPWP